MKAGDQAFRKGMYQHEIVKENETVVKVVESPGGLTSLEATQGSLKGALTNSPLQARQATVA